MAHLRWPMLLALGATLAACADGTTNRDLTSPDDEFAVALTRPVGDAIFPLVPGHTQPIRVEMQAPGTRPVGALLAADARLAAAQVAGGGRGSGDADITYLGARQTYTFTGRSAAPWPSATGTIHVSIVHPLYTMEIDATIDCLVASGTEAWLSGPVSLFVFNGVARPATIHLLFKVQDNGEGSGAPPDLVSPPFGAGPQSCVPAPTLPTFPNAATGRIQFFAT